ncbi:MAG TPA: alpha-glucosidase/alpha-galactosidase, partial [Clostridia bacterium]|nr:alpha-glucosidase/alpha-galactosidase [Clostridia bacterium]
MHKIAFIGAGSFGFTRGLVRDLLTYPAFRDAELALMDIDPQRLAWIEKAVRRIVGEGGYPATVTATLDRREALTGASGVISTILIGGLPVFRGDLEIPMKYGVNFCVGDTRGVPAIFRFLRTGPVLLSICEDIRELCPNAVFLNYSNP